LRVGMTELSKFVSIIDDDRDFTNSLVELLEIEGFDTKVFNSAELATRRINSDYSGVVLLDIRMPGTSGHEVLRRLLAIDKHLPIIHITGHGDIPMAVNALKHGAYGFFTKPLDTDELLRDINNALIVRHTELERRRLASALALRDDLAATVIGGSAPMITLRQEIAKIAGVDVDVLISGETGSGKELVATALVEASGRRDAPLVAINCNHVSHAQATDELFGLETLLASGEINIRIGKFERANGGTLLLDEIESMPLDMQGRLQRVVQERSLERINGASVVPLDLRIIATTRVNLSDLVREGSFREDLFYLLSGVRLDVPPLRLRGADSVLLFDHFIKQLGSEAEISPSLMSDLLSHDWPGNIQELHNAAQRYATGLGVFSAGDVDRKNSLAARVADFEKSLIEAALEQNSGSLKGAMLDLDVPRKTLYDKITKHGIDKDKFTK